MDVYENEQSYFFSDCSDQVLDDDMLANLLTYPNVIITAHQAFLTKEALEVSTQPRSRVYVSACFVCVGVCVCLCPSVWPLALPCLVRVCLSVCHCVSRCIYGCGCVGVCMVCVRAHACACTYLSSSRTLSAPLFVCGCVCGSTDYRQHDTRKPERGSRGHVLRQRVQSTPQKVMHPRSRNDAPLPRRDAPGVGIR